MRKLALVIMLMLVAATANDYLSSLVENYGDGSYTVGELWSGYEDYTSHIMVEQFTVERAASQSYPDFPIKISANFANDGSGPLWTGYTPLGESVPDFTYSNFFKILYSNDGVWEEKPSQVSVNTRCYDAVGNQGACSLSNHHVAYLELWMVDDLTTDSQTYRIYYLSSVDTDAQEGYRFTYNSTSSKYYYSESAYSARMQWIASTRKLYIPELNANYTFSSTYDLTDVLYGTCTQSTAGVTGGIYNCASGTNLMFDMTPITSNMDIPLMFELEKTACNLMTLGSGTGSAFLRVTPLFTTVKVESLTSSSTEAELFDMGGTISISWAEQGGVGPQQRISQYSSWSNASSDALVSFTSYASNTTSTNWGGLGGDQNTIVTVTNKQVSIPLFYRIKSTTSNTDKLTQIKGSTRYTASAFNPWVIINENQVFVDEIESNDRWILNIGPYKYTPSQGYCSALADGLTSWDIYSDIVDSEDFDSYIGVDAGDFSTPCVSDTPNYCAKGIGWDIDSDTGYRLKLDGDICPDSPTGFCELDCNGGEYGYYDSCGTWNSCGDCGTCASNSTGLHCGSKCYGYWNTRTCLNSDGDDDGRLYGVFSCDFVNYTYPLVEIEDCNGAGCNAGKCNDQSTLSTLLVHVLDHFGNSAITANVTMTGSDASNNEYTTSDLAKGANGAYFTLAPGNYLMKGASTGYQTGAENCKHAGGVQQFNYSDGCIITVGKNKLYYPSFSMLQDGQSTNLTKIVVTTMFRDNLIQGANVTIDDGSTPALSSTTGYDGSAIFTPVTGAYEYEISANKTGYVLTSVNKTIQVGKINRITIYMDKQTDIAIFSNFQDGGNRVFASGFITDKVTIPFRFSQPGTVSISRDDVIVRPCKNLGCSEYDKLGLNVLWVFGSRADTPFIYDADTGTIVTVTAEEFKDIVSDPSCTSMNRTYAMDTRVKLNSTGSSTSYTSATSSTLFVARECEYDGKDYVAIFLTSKPEDDEAIRRLMQDINDNARNALLNSGQVALAAGIQAFYSAFGQKLGDIVIVSLTEAMNPIQRQDLLTDYVIFNVDYDTLMDLSSDNSIECVTIQGFEKCDTPLNILIDPAYSPLVRTGRDPLVDDHGMLSIDVRRTNTDSDMDSVGLGYGLEKMSYKADYMKVPVQTNLTFSIMLSDLTKDVEYDLKTQNYASASVKYFEQGKTGGYMKAPIENTLFKAETYLKITFQPSDPSQEEQTEYVKIISFIDTAREENGMFLWVIGIGAVLLFAPLLLLALSVMRG